MNKQLKQYLPLIKKYEFILSSLLVLVFTSVLAVKLLYPNFLKVNEIYVNKSELKAKLLRLSQKENKLNNLNLNILKTNFIKLNNVIPSQKDYVLLFETLDRLEGTTGVSITRTDFQLGTISTTSAKLKKEAVNGVFKLPVTIEAVGNYDSMILFLTYLSNLTGRLITVDKIQLELSDIVLAQMHISGTAYYNPFPSDIGKVDTALKDLSSDLQVLYQQVIDNQPDISLTEEPEVVPLGSQDLFFK